MGEVRGGRRGRGSLLLSFLLGFSQFWSQSRTQQWSVQISEVGQGWLAKNADKRRTDWGVFKKKYWKQI